MNHPLKKTVVTLSLAATLVAGLSACGGSNQDAAPSGTSASVSTSNADVVFAQSMIPHHEQAVEMADLALAPNAGASAQVRDLARQIKGAQAPEIQQMTGWLNGWGAPTAMPGSDGSNDLGAMDHSGHDMAGMTMAGMMTADDMRALAAASGTEFDRLWLEMMIAHHEGAIAMAGQVDTTSQDPQVKALADAIVIAQNEEITTMQKLLAR
ncbi:MAG TPA: DUF305 domain-containing protein [Actinomycetota bacterium]|nr:DUF305 domain-containing protein [Actinomycetota bacterium]HRV65074.1 DUF305 domain-containing protein [Candidatus Nanopelagicales bacterium]